MILKDCKRLAEVDFVLSAVNDACVEENNRKPPPGPRMAGTWRVRRPRLPFSKAPLGPRATSTVCSW